MSTETFIRAELSKIERIVNNETYLASERAGHSVDPYSPEIQCRVGLTPRVRHFITEVLRVR